MTEILNLLSQSLRMLVLILTLCIVTLIIIAETHLPSVEILKDVQLKVPLRIYTSDQKLIAEFGEERRTPLNIEDVPQPIINAILSTEDRRFYKHPGVDLRGILRAAMAVITTGHKEQGGSTITMQVARNFFLTRKKTYIRKINEILLALKIEQKLTKDEILELYINKIYFGKRAYGIAAAAEVYYGTTVDKLTLAQMAMLAGLPQAPSSINPLNSEVAALKRRNHVLSRMLSYGFISEEQYNIANGSPLTAKYHGKLIEVQADFVAEMVRQELLEKYGENIYSKGYEVVTTIDSKQQKAANNALNKAILEYDKRHPYRGNLEEFNVDHHLTTKLLQKYKNINNLIPAVIESINSDQISVLLKDGNYGVISTDNIPWKNLIKNNVLKIGSVIYTEKQTNNEYKLSQLPDVEGAIVALSPKTGEIKALVGGFNFHSSPFNRVTQAKRQTGSSFKPFVYGAALENGFTAASIINDAPIVEYDTGDGFAWRPQNDSRQFYGPTRLRTGLIKSRNLVSIRLMKAIGIEKSIEFIEKFGFHKEDLPNSLSLALGAGSTTPLAMASAFSVYANGGYKVEPHFIKEIKDYDDQIIYEYNIQELSMPVIKPQTAFIINSMMSDAIQNGTGKRAKKLNRKDLSGKTGTTNDQIDAWYSGFNTEIVATTWIGFDEPRTLKEYGSQAALPMWIYFMEGALQDTEEKYLPEPEGLVTVKIDPKTGLLARSDQKDAIYEIFEKETVPDRLAPSSYSENNTEELSNIDTLF